MPAYNKRFGEIGRNVIAKTSVRSLSVSDFFSRMCSNNENIYLTLHQYYGQRFM